VIYVIWDTKKCRKRAIGEIWRRYLRDIREKAKSLDLAILVAGGIIWFTAFAVSVLDFTVFQGMVYRFDLVGLTGLIFGLVGFAIRTQGGGSGIPVTSGRS